MKIKITDKSLFTAKLVFFGNIGTIIFKIKILNKNLFTGILP
jgi:hypothetical protein